MVWSQYVYEASAGTEAHSSDDEHTESEENTLLNIHTYYDAYSDDLWYLWDVLRQLLYDAFLDTKYQDLSFHDWLEFCYFDADEEDTAARRRPDDDMRYVWHTLRREDRDGILHNKTLEDFEEFLLSYSIP